MDASFVLLACIAVLTALVAGGLTYDRSAARLGMIVVDGAARRDTRVVVTRRWVNGRTGLLNHAGLAEGGGLLLRGSRAVHTRGMLFPIDIVFLDRGGRVLAAHAAVAPGHGRMSGPRGCVAALELAAGAAARLGIGCGKTVQIEAVLTS